ncbi:MAG: hypothetical protein AAGF23_09630 [Acidobacteriota bacterium]
MTNYFRPSRRLDVARRTVSTGRRSPLAAWTTLPLLLLSALAPAFPARAQDGPSPLIWGGFGLARGASVEGAPSWRDGGFGVFESGAEDDESSGLGQAHMTLEWRPSDRWGAYVHAVARAEPEALEGREVGVVEAYAEVNFEARDADLWTVRLGHYLLPTSRENVDVGWSSPYALSFSALNTWIGEEVRATGALGIYQLAVGQTDEIQLGGGVFYNNDTAGTLIAWRGWALGDRLSVYGEYAPLPPLRGFMEGGAFDIQDPRGTNPFGSDLDGRAGWNAFAGYSRPEVGSVRYTHYDNRGDRGFYVNEYAWRTRFDLIGADYHWGPWSFAAEWMDGSTGMGDPTERHVQLDYRAGYVLASYGGAGFRVTARYDDFETIERDESVGYDPNDGGGSAWALAAFYEPERYPLRLGAEWLDVDAERTSSGLVTGDRTVGGQSLTVELRYFFGN